MNPPVAKKIRKDITACGDTQTDYYYWLNDRENPEVIRYLKAENKYTDNKLSEITSFRENIYNEIVSRVKQTDESVPYKLRGYYYYYRFEENKEYPVYCRKKGTMEASEEIILDENELAKNLDYCEVETITVSPDNKFLAFAIDTVSRRLYTLKIKNLTTGEILPDTIENTGGDIVWANDNKTIFYSLKNEETLRSEWIYKHTLNSDGKLDKEIFHETDDTFYAEVLKTKSDQYIMIASSSTVSDEYRFIDANSPDDEFKIIEPRKRDLEYSVDHYRNKFYIRTNYKAKNFRLTETPVTKPGLENWTEVVPYNPEILLDDFEIFKNYLVLAERQNASNQIRIISWDDKTEHYIQFTEEAFEAGLDNNPDFDSDMLRINYSSLTTPNSVIDYSIPERKKTILKKQEVIGTFRETDYESKKIFAAATDGTKVPVSIVYRKGINLNSSNPLLLYGYGAYGYSIDPYFSSPRLSLLNRGFVFAIAHVRGGEEMGREWYENGKMLHKKNSFTDFIACAQTLIDLKYTSAEKLFAMGGSAGGLLMGAVINLAPELFKGVVAAVPFVDVVTTMLHEDIPLTTGEYDEWGNPNIKEYYDYIKSYSPYDNVEAKNYPNLLVTTGLHDSQVQYWEPAKWVAKLRENKTDQNLLLLYTNMDAGHGGASGRFEKYKETALEYSFILYLLNIRK
jgi:oligopeptidase B